MWLFDQEVSPSLPHRYLGIVLLHFSLISLEIILLPACLNVMRVKTFLVGEMASGMRVLFVEIWPLSVSVWRGRGGGAGSLAPCAPADPRLCVSEGVPGPSRVAAEADPYLSTPNTLRC